MKKILFLACFLLISFISNAQEDDKNFDLGFTLSPNLSWVTNDGDKLVSDGAKPGFTYGVIADLGFAKNYFFSTGFTITSLHSQAETTDNSREKYKLQYIEIPLTLKLKSNTLNERRFYGQFGLGTGINIAAKKDVKSLGTTASGDDIGISSDVNAIRLGLVAGAGVEWNIGKNLSVVTGLTLNNAFTKTFKKYDSKNPYLSLNLGLFF